MGTMCRCDGAIGRCDGCCKVRQLVAGALVRVLRSVLIGALGLGGCILDPGEEHSSVFVQPIPVQLVYLSDHHC